MRYTILLTGAALLCAACAEYPGANDTGFGQSVTRARASQVIDPEAPTRRRTPLSQDGQAAKSSIDRYQKSYEQPPAPVNVLNIGVGSGTTSAQP